jgi:hypothetical protein
MTSGFEIVGVVLAFYPIVVDAWQAYKAAKSGIEINQMIQRLKTEQIIFHEFVHHLVGSSISEAERARLNTSHPREAAGCWKDPALESDLKMRLGYVKMQNILTIVGNIHTLLKSMSEELPGAGQTFVCFCLSVLLSSLPKPNSANLISDFLRFANTLHSHPSSICDHPSIILGLH